MKENQSYKQNYNLVADTIEPKKRMSKRVTYFARKHVTDKTLFRMKECNSFMQLIGTHDLSTKKQIAGNSCKNRFCPLCNWRKARKDGMSIAIMMQAIKQDTDYNFLFLTLTVPNVKADMLNDSIIKMNKAFDNMQRTKPFQRVSNGYVRKLELTYNAKRDDYHPHMHVLIAVDKTYFKNTRKYLTQSDWLAMWQHAMSDDSIKIIDIRRVKDNSNDKSFLEIAKYSAKDTDLIHSQETFDTFYNALKGKRLLSYAGIFKDYLKSYKAGTLDSYKKVDTNEYVYLITANFYRNEYKEVAELLTQEQMTLFNKHLIDETDLRD